MEMKAFLFKVSILIFNCEVLRYTTKYSSDVTRKFIEIWGACKKVLPLLSLHFNIVSAQQMLPELTFWHIVSTTKICFTFPFWQIWKSLLHVVWKLNKWSIPTQSAMLSRCTWIGARILSAGWAQARGDSLQGLDILSKHLGCTRCKRFRERLTGDGWFLLASKHIVA